MVPFISLARAMAENKLRQKVYVRSGVLRHNMKCADFSKKITCHTKNQEEPKQYKKAIYIYSDGLNCVLPKGHVKALTPSTSECNLICK